MKLKLIALLATGFTLAMTTQFAFAYGSQAGAITLTPAVGEYIFDNQRDIDNGTMPTLSLGYNFTNNWGVEALVGRTKTDSSDIPEDTNITGYYFDLDGLYRFVNCTNFEPFLMAGVGALTLQPDEGLSMNDPLSQDPRTQANVNAGLGVQYFFNNVVSLRADARDIYSVTNTSNTGNGKNDVLWTIGLGFAFDAAQPNNSYYHHA